MSEFTRYCFGRRQRLTSDRDYQRVFGARCRKIQGPLAVHACPNGLSACRLGLSVSRRVGGAVKRNRIKRLLREAFRLMQHDWPRGLDVVIAVRPHEPLRLAEYQRLLSRALRGINDQWAKRQRRRSDDSAKRLPDQGQL